MRYIRKLTAAEIKILEYGYENGNKHFFRIKCKSLLLSNEGKTINEISIFAGKTPRTIRNWFDSLEKAGIEHLGISPGRGIKAPLDSLNEEDILEVKKVVKRHYQKLDVAGKILGDKFGFSVTKKMLNRFLKKKSYTWRRLRKSLKAKRNEIEYQAKLVQLCGLLWLEKQGFTKIYYGDESGFSLVPCIPYGWQEKGNPICIVPVKGKRLNAFGLFTRNNEIEIYTSEQSINSDLTIAFIDDFCERMQDPSIIVLDNATIHHSDMFKQKIEEWEESGLFIFYLPRYSPHLNLIETLWRKIKYE